VTFQETVSALAYVIVRQRCGPKTSEVSHERVAEFVLAQHGRMPDYLRLPLKILTLVFSISSMITSGRPFHRMSCERQCRQVSRWKTSWLGPCRDLIKFYESLVIFGCYAEGTTPSVNRFLAGKRHDSSLRKGSTAGR
jgi:hypothetical protein